MINYRRSTGRVFEAWLAYREVNHNVYPLSVASFVAGYNASEAFTSEHGAPDLPDGASDQQLMARMDAVFLPMGDYIKEPDHEEVGAFLDDITLSGRFPTDPELQNISPPDSHEVQYDQPEESPED